VPHLADGIARLVETEAYGTFHMAGRGGTSRWDLACEFFRVASINTRPTPVSRLSFKAAAERPAYSVLTTLQDPCIELPPWQQGVAEFARRLA
jgi:dTDP-4-dehydrorhamnose reductase